MNSVIFERKTHQGTWLLLSSGYGLTDQIISRRLDDYKRQYGNDTVRARSDSGQLLDIR